jgi:hypothetical protein
MKLMRLSLRLWIAATSVFSFVAGWIMLAHAPKPVQSSSSAAGTVLPLPTLEPLPPLDLSNASGVGDLGVSSFITQQRPRLFSQVPLFSTGGS